MNTPPATRICPNCAAPASSWAQFCRECGTTLPPLGQLAIGDDLTHDQTLLPVERTVPWRAWEGLLIWIGAIIPPAVVSAIILLVTGWNCRAEDLSGAEATGCNRVFVTSLVANELALLLFTFGWVKARYGATPGMLGLRPLTMRAVRIGLTTAAAGMAIAYGVNILIGVVYELITDEALVSPKQVDLHGTPGIGLLLILGLVVVLLAPIAEEVFFRGFVYRGLRRWATPAVATALSALLFGVAHFIPLVVLSTALLGVVLARVVEKEGDIMPAVVAHVAFNAVGLVILLGFGEF